jgi:EH domain-containing protein 1
MSRWLKKKAEVKEPEVYLTVLDGIKKIYANKIKPLEQLYNFDIFHSPILRDSDFDAKPMVLLLGQYSTGKTSFIRYLLETDYPGHHIGPEPTTDRFVSVMYGPKEMVTPGNALAVQADKPFSGLQKFGVDFLNKFQSSETPAPILQDLMFIDTPGVLSGEKQRIGRAYDFIEVIDWFAERADMIVLLFDAHKLDISDEFKRAIDAVKNQPDKIRVVLNKADMVSGQQLMRVYGALMWSLGKVLGTPEVTRVYIGSFWDKPYQNDECKKLFEAEQSDLLKDLYGLPKNAVVRKINDLVKRARKAKVHAYVLSYIKDQMPSVFGKQKKQEEIIEGIRNIFITIHQRYQLPVGDFPDITKFKEVLKAQSDFTKFAKLNEKMILQMDEVLANDIPRLMQQFPNERDAKLSTNPFEFASPFDDISIDEGPISQEERTKSREIFNTLYPVNGKITGKAASTILVQSKLPRDALSKIWVLSDRDKDGLLNEEEFIIALWLVRQTLEGKPIPLALPSVLQLNPEKLHQQQQMMAVPPSNTAPSQQMMLQNDQSSFQQPQTFQPQTFTPVYGQQQQTPVSYQQTPNPYQQESGTSSPFADSL